MAVTTRGGKKTIDPLMSSVVVGDIRKDEDVVEASRELGDSPTKEVELYQKVVPITMKDGKYR